jgi:dUTP pyrophosphatase
MKDKILFKKIVNRAELPKKAYDTDACYDVVATSVEDLHDGRYRYGLGFSVQLPPNTRLDLRPRSSIHKTGMLLSNCIGTGDEGYTGEYQAVFYHILRHLPIYKIGDRILQIHVEKRNDVDFVIIEDELSATERGDGGFGSTNK